MATDLKIFDTHTHLNVRQFDEDVPEVIKRGQELGVVKMAVVGFDEETIPKSLSLSRNYPFIYSIVGWHPTEAGSYMKEVEEQLILTLTEQPKIVALGEIGLDYHWMEDPKDVQEKVFRRQIAISRELSLPISVHNREATEDTYRILKDEKIWQNGGIMHSFGENEEWAKKFLDLGMHLSYSGVVTFKKAVEVQRAVQITPLDKLLVETDAPYLAPVPYRGKRNEPGYTRYVVEKIAEVKAISAAEVAAQSWQNSHKLFRIEE